MWKTRIKKRISVRHSDPRSRSVFESVPHNHILLVNILFSSSTLHDDHVKNIEDVHGLLELINHKNLNDCLCMNATYENVARWIAEQSGSLCMEVMIEDEQKTSVVYTTNTPNG